VYKPLLRAYVERADAGVAASAEELEELRRMREEAWDSLYQHIIECHPELRV
jgi:hypothetical protein